MKPILPDIPVVGLGEDMNTLGIASVLREYSELMQDNKSAVACVVMVLGDDGLAQTWIRAHDGAKPLLALIMGQVGHDLVTGIPNGEKVH